MNRTPCVFAVGHNGTVVAEVHAIRLAEVAEAIGLVSGESPFDHGWAAASRISASGPMM